MAGLSHGSDHYYAGMFIDNNIIIAYILGIVFSTSLFPFLRSIINNLLLKTDIGYSRVPGLFVHIGYNIIILVILFLCVIQVASVTYHPFLYFKF